MFGCLRKIKDDELQLILSWRNSPSVRSKMYSRHIISTEEHLEWWKKIYDSNTHLYFMYELEEKPLGVVAFTGIDEVSNNSFWAFYAAPEAPKGTGSRMEFLALEYAFNELNLHKIQCEVLDFNTPVIKLHEKFGFKIEGILRAQHKTEESFANIYRLGMLSTEWKTHSAVMKKKLNRYTSPPL
jgi:UDP-4-amino-4,6-dideoxy-N-acetyl-beta-L-altrosamine N-acetyltransferase